VWSKVNTYCQYLLVLLVNPKAIPRSSQAIRRNTKVANTLVGIGNPRQHFGRSRRAFRLAAEEAWRALIGWKSMGLGVRFHACSATPSYNIMTTQLSTLAADGSQSQYTPSTAPSDDLSSIRDDFTVLFAQTSLPPSLHRSRTTQTGFRLDDRRLVQYLPASPIKETNPSWIWEYGERLCDKTDPSVRY
jgi:hypothetical protein